MAILATLLAVVTPACPSWCTAPPEQHTRYLGHLLPAGAIRHRLHRAPLGSWGKQDVEVRRSDLEQLDGTVTHEPACIVLNGADVLDLDQARDLLKGLTLAVELATGGAA